MSAPSPPLNVVATPKDASLTFNFAAPATDGGDAIIGYTAVIRDMTNEVDLDPMSVSPGTENTVTDLTNGVSYRVSVIAINSFGDSEAGISSNVTPMPAPNAPESVSYELSGVGAVTFSFTPSPGGATFYTATVVRLDNRNKPVETMQTFNNASPNQSLTVNGLTVASNIKYRVVVVATNSYGDSPFANSSIFSVAELPGVPRINIVTAGNAQATISFSTPATNGGSAITSYTVTSNPGGFTASGSSSPITVTGLTNGTSYTFTMTATNAIGTGSASGASSSVTPVTVPGAPTAVSATAGNAQATISFSAPSSNGGSAITSYTVTSNPGGFTASGSSSPVTVTGLTNGTPYTFTVTATNLIGTSSASDASSSVTPATGGGGGGDPPSVGFTSYFVSAISATSINVSWAISDESSVTSYDIAYLARGSSVTVNPTGAPTYSHTLSGLTPNTTYTVQVSAFLNSGPAVRSSIQSVTTQSEGGASGDPYVTTVKGAQYKLPTIDAPIRFYQGEVGGKTLTVNAKLRTISSAELLAHNLRSMITLSKSLSAKQIRKYATDLSKEETLCFFESFFVKHGDNELKVNVWDGKIKVQKYVGKFSTTLIADGETALAGSGIYSKYKGVSLVVKAGSASIQLSAYQSPIVRSGISVDAPNMADGNGVIVNILSSKDMTLASLEDAESVVSRKDETTVRVRKEMFSDHAGTRVRNIVTVK